MKTRAFLSALGILFLCSGTTRIAFGDEVRNWRSTNGKSIRGEIIDVRDGKAIIRPATKLIEAPLDKLVQSDREYIEKWQVEHERRKKELEQAEIMIAMQKPLGKALIGRTVIVKGRKVEQYKLKNVKKLKYVLLYRATPETNKHVGQLNKLYKRLRGRYDNFEFIAIGYGRSAKEADDFLLENEIEFPAVRMTSLNRQGVEPIAQLFDRPIVPQIAVIDASGKIISDSYVPEDPANRRKKKNSNDNEWTGPNQNYNTPMDDIAKLVRDAAKVAKAKDGDK